MTSLLLNCCFFTRFSLPGNYTSITLHPIVPDKKCLEQRLLFQPNTGLLLGMPNKRPIFFCNYWFIYWKSLSYFYWSFSKGDGKGIWISSPRTPKAPKHGPRPPRLYKMDIKQIAAVLFRETTFPSKCIVPPGLPRPVLKPVASNRVLFCEDELCQAVAQNKLR